MTTSFVGRGTELERLEQSLVRNRLTTLTGPAGVGKSRLALHAATGDDKSPVPAICWADLSPLPDEGRFVATIGAAVGLADHTTGVPLDPLLAYLADKEMLIVLDTCDHLVAACRDLVGRLLEAAPRVTVLATSRQPLGVAGEQLLPLAPLPCEGDALTLFAERAAAASPGLTVSEVRDSTAALRICRRLEGVPLALELAAARAVHLSLEVLAELVESPPPDLLDSSGPTEPSRPVHHHSLRTAIGWSHELSAPRERLLWARLSVFRDRFDERAVREVCAGGPLTEAGATEALARLVAGSVVEKDAQGRYRMLGSVRRYGAMWLRELGETGAVADRHARYFLELARKADQGWLGPGQATWYRTVAAAHTDLCTALDHFLPREPQLALELSGRVAFFWNCCGHLRAARSYIEQALARPHAPGADRTRALWVLGLAALLQGEHERAGELARRCELEASRARDTEGRLSAAYLLGITHLLSGRPLAAAAAADSALARSGGSPFESAALLRCLLLRVFALTALGLTDEAVELAGELRERCFARGEYWTRSYADYQLALLALMADRPEEARVHARSMLDAKRLLGDKYGIAMGLELLASAAASDGRGETAALVAGVSQAYWSAVGHAQQGMPELRQLRAECERAARDAVGDVVYDSAFELGLEQDVLAALTHEGCATEG
ncbi:ATP-binding protein [Streptomyces sp. NPDC050504]|uniref:ATP-binding protein n=1 Tax=Streptomyces sp. NPDC050504 TaxID=3365618 RepID=UPI0037B7064B